MAAEPAAGVALRLDDRRWTKDPRYFPVRRAAMSIIAPGASAVAVYFFVIGYWVIGGMAAAIAAFCFYRWRRLRS